MNAFCEKVGRKEKLKERKGTNQGLMVEAELIPALVEAVKKAERVMLEAGLLKDPHT
jgi:hypothetical protein